MDRKLSYPAPDDVTRVRRVGWVMRHTRNIVPQTITATDGLRSLTLLPVLSRRSDLSAHSTSDSASLTDIFLETNFGAVGRNLVI